MKFQLLVAAFAALASASPIASYERETQAADIIGIEKRQTVGTTENEFTRGGCRKVIFFFARGSTEAGNMGSTVGPPTGRGIKQAFGDADVAVEGIDYGAALSTNFLPGGADLAGIAEMRDLINTAVSRCPTSFIVVGGYSQGAALVHRAVENLSTAVKARIAAAVTFGDTQNLQDRGRIPNFDTSKTLIICNAGDAVCAGTLTILPAHLDYVRRVPEAVAFYTSRLRALGVS